MTGAHIAHHSQAQRRGGTPSYAHRLRKQKEAYLGLGSRRKVSCRRCCCTGGEAGHLKGGLCEYRRKTIHVIKKKTEVVLLNRLYLYNSLYHKLYIGLKGRRKNLCLYSWETLHPWVLHPWIQSNADQKYSREKTSQKAKISKSIT